MHNDKTDRFTEDVDRLLRETGRIDASRPGAEYRKDLVFAAELAATDFSTESTRQASLRRDLLGGHATRQVSTRNGSTWAAGPWRYSRLATAATALAVVLIIVVAEPHLRAAVVQPAINYLKQIIVGEHTQAVVAEGFDEDEMTVVLAERARALEAGELWSIRTAVSTVGGDVPPGDDPVILTYSSLGLAESAAAFPLAKPEYLPENFSFDKAVITPGDGVVLWYAAPGQRITLYQRLVVPGAGTMAMAMGAGSSLEEVSIHGHRAAWMNDQKLVWESEGKSFDLEGTRLTLEQALEIARSLH